MQNDRVVNDIEALKTWDKGDILLYVEYLHGVINSDDEMAKGFKKLFKIQENIIKKLASKL